MHELVQGDIMFVRVDGPVPAGARKIDTGIVAYGEATGHAHRVVGAATVFEVAADRLLVEVVGTAEVVHDEHGTITTEHLDPGVWEVRRQDQYLPNEIVRVTD